MKAVTLLLLALCLFGTAAPLRAKTMQQKLDAACAADVARLCAPVAADPDKTKACMLQHRRDVLPACMALIDASE